ncbi:MAG TPA: 16S rRNA (adenine(1518)-N(6)/adenine(1519)-N(6))-dimethyltransferase RsmA [Alphaproteobacteria bacterium]|nr:16S rRNA (adenine(1518)-N(6)/adenine(1519)-N(6))-dimethyltransferase RsmA [Alphaproteobacteria bacterium]
MTLLPGLAGLPPLKEVIAARGLAARKSLGQHFLLDPGITARIASAAGNLADRTVIEVGPGPGGLTRALLAAGASPLIAIERDDRCIAALQDVVAASDGRLRLVPADAIEADERALVADAEGKPPALIVANLPYNIATVLILKWLERADLFADIVVMVQKEVAQRLAAKPGADAYGRLAVMVNWRAAVTPLFDLAPGAFTPPPKVTSTVVRITPRATPLCDADPSTLEAVVKAAFGQRRKMLRSALKSLGRDPLPPLEQAAIAPTARAEELSIEEFCALARAYAAKP